MRIGDTALRALRLRAFAIYWSAQTLSVVADYAFMVALAIHLAVVQHRPGLLAAVLTANVGTRIALLLVGGVVTDRAGARSIVIAGDLVRAAAVGGLAIAFLADRDAAAVYVACGALLGAGDALFTPAYGVVIPELVPDADLTSANSVRLGGEVFAAAVGPALGGAATAAGGFGWLLAAEPITFLVAALAAAISVPRSARSQPSAPEQRSTMLGDARDGLLHALRAPFILRGVMFLAIATLAIDGPQDVLLPVHASDRAGLALGTAGFGWLTACGGIGALVGAAWWGRRDTPAGRRARSLGFCYVIWGAGFATCGWNFGALALAGMVVAGFGVAGEDVVWYTAVQRATPRQLLGRTLAFSDLASLSTKPASYMLAGLAVGRIPLGTMIVGGGAVTAMSGVMILRGALRSLD
jgi:MFS family permease